MQREIWSRWKKFGRWMGDAVARVFLVLFYFTIALPFGLLVRYTQDPLDAKASSKVSWLPRVTKDKTLDDAGRSF